MQLAEHRRTLKGIQSIERKIEAKRTMLPVYKPWIDGLLAADRGGQDDVLVTVMLWTLDTGDLEGAFNMADYVIRHGLSTPDRYERTAATLIAEEVADTAIKLQETGAGPSYGLLCAYLELLTDCDIFDQVRAKLHKAVGRACLADGRKQLAADHYRRAIELHDKVGIKKELEVLERELKRTATRRHWRRQLTERTRTLGGSGLTNAFRIPDGPTTAQQTGYHQNQEHHEHRINRHRTDRTE